MNGPDDVLRLSINGRAVTVRPLPSGVYAWRVDDPRTSDWMRGQAPDAMLALRAATAAADRLAGLQHAVRGDGFGED